MNIVFHMNVGAICLVVLSLVILVVRRKSRLKLMHPKGSENPIYKIHRVLDREMLEVVLSALTA
jgi:hypothetical protein